MRLFLVYLLIASMAGLFKAANGGLPLEKVALFAVGIAAIITAIMLVAEKIIDWFHG